MISPAFWMTTASPIMMSLRSSSSALCRRRALDGRAGKLHGLELGHRRDLARLADLNVNAQQPRDRLLGLVLEGDRPPRALAPRAEPLALVEVVDLDHQAVGLEIERVALLVPALGVLDHLLDRVVASSCGGSPGCPSASSTA